jgi:hypothetical protein
MIHGFSKRSGIVITIFGKYTMIHTPAKLLEDKLWA